MESAIITHLKEFLLEMGRSFAFVARQQHIPTDTEDYYIDLVFYNIVLKRYVLTDLKLGKIRHQDVGQMDMYVRMYDELKRTEGDNATLPTDKELKAEIKRQKSIFYMQHPELKEEESK